MDTANRRLAKNTIYLYFRSLILLLINLYTSRMILQILGIEDFGVYNVVGGVVAMFSMLGSTMQEASQRFITFALGQKNIDHLRNVFSTSCTTHLLLASIVIILIEFLGVWFMYHGIQIPQDRYLAAFWVMQFCITSLFISVISVPYNALLIAHERMSTFAYISIFEGALKLTSVLILVLFDFDKLILYALLQFVIGVTIRGIYVSYCKKNFAETQKLKYSIDRSLFKEMFAFAGWNLFGSGSLILRTQGIDILLNMFYGVTVNAAKGICNQVENAVGNLVGNFTTSIRPQLTKSIAQENYDRAHYLILKGSRFSFLLMVLFTVPLTTCTDEVFELWLVNVPPYAVDMVRLAFLYMLMDTMSRFLTSGLLAYGDIRNFQLSIGILKLLTFPLAWILLIYGGSPLTGIWANIIIEFMALAGRLYLAKKRLHIKVKGFLVSVTFRCWAVWLLCIVGSTLFYYYVSKNIIIAGGTSVTYCIMTMWFLGLESSERNYIIDHYIKKAISK